MQVPTSTQINPHGLKTRHLQQVLWLVTASHKTGSNTSNQQVKSLTSHKFVVILSDSFSYHQPVIVLVLETYSRFSRTSLDSAGSIPKQVETPCAPNLLSLSQTKIRGVFWYYQHTGNHNQEKTQHFGFGLDFCSPTVTAWSNFVCLQRKLL